MKLLLCVLALAVLSSCSSLRPVPIAKITDLPVIQVGSEPPNEGDFVVFFPEGADIPVALSTSGSLFSSQVRLEGRATLSRNLYLYKSWASHDGVNWENSHELIGVNFEGGFDVSGLQSDISLIAQ